MDEREKRELRLLGEIASVTEKGGYTYQEVTDALLRLLEYYKTNGRFFLNGIKIVDVAQYQQQQYKKRRCTDQEHSGEDLV